MLKSRSDQIRTRQATPWVGMILGILLAVGLTGCMINNVPRYAYSPEGEEVQYKRYEKHVDLDYLHNRTAVAYQRADALPLEPILSEKQQEILETNGKPDYIRKDYLAETKEIATDWVFMEKRMIYQFVEGDLVFEGELTDYDEILIRRGRPTSSLSPTNEIGHRLDVLRYKNVMTNMIDEYVFRNGRVAGRLKN